MPDDASTPADDRPLAVVTGAFSYTGRVVAARLLARGYRLRTLTGHPPADGTDRLGIEVAPYNFDDPQALVESLKGACVLVNTYWVRFAHGDTTHARAVANTRVMIDAAKEAGVGRFVHVSIANPTRDLGLTYYHGKAEIEDMIEQSGIPYTILRPAVLFGDATGEAARIHAESNGDAVEEDPTRTPDVLINNISWFIRHLPVFGIPGLGRYGIQPIHVADFGRLLADEACRDDGNSETFDACGPDSYTFAELLHTIRRTLGAWCLILPTFPVFAWLGAAIAGKLIVRDVVLTRDEVKGLRANLLVSNEPPRGTTSLTAWMTENKDALGRRYANELGRHF